MDYDPLRPDVIANPYPHYQALLSTSRPQWNAPTHSWLVATYDEAQRILRDAHTFSRDPRRTGEELPRGRQNIQTIDPPAHGPLRSIFTNSMNTVALQPLEEQTSIAITARLKAVDPAEELDFMTALCEPIAMGFISELMGINSDTLTHFKGLSEAVTKRMDATMDASAAARGDAARYEINAIVDDWVQAPGSSQLLTEIYANSKVSAVDNEHIRNTVAVLFNAGFSTSYALLGNVAHRIAESQQILTEIAAGGAAAVAAAADEFVRMDGPVQGTTRVTIEPVVIAGQPIDAMSSVLVLLGAANRDPRQFNDPDAFRINRESRDTLSYGWGPHYCIGSRIAGVLVRAFITSLVALQRTVVAHDAVAWRPTATIRCPNTMRVSIPPSDRS